MVVRANQPVFGTLAVVGLGLIGSSILRRSAIFGGLAQKIIAVDCSSKVCARVEELELADEVSEEASAVAGADCVILCVPVGAMGDVASKMIPHMKAHSLLMDTGSTKCSVIDAIVPFMKSRPDISYVPSHPMAGTEFSGPDAGLADLFEDAWCLMTPIEQSSRVALEKAHLFWARCGAKVNEISPQHHDDICSKVSHLPHFISFTICQMVCAYGEGAQKEIIDYSASGFQDFTRIAASDPTMWRDIFLSNRDALLKTLDDFQANFNSLRKAIAQEDGDGIVQAIKKGNYLRARLVDEK